MRIGVIGAKGNMGKRYCSILEFLGVPYVEVDIGLQNSVQDCNGLIVATPTITHVDVLRYYSRFGLPVLCEKPITTNIEELNHILDYVDHPLRMVNQYDYFEFNRLRNRSLTKVLNMQGNEETSYNYFKTGNDGLLWDCINIVGLSKGSLKIDHDSPIWKLILNGQFIDFKEIDYSYIWNIQDWLQYMNGNEGYILESHQKIEGLINASNCDRCSG